MARISRRQFLGLVAAADQPLDIMLLQTSASIENVLVSAYETMLGLPLFTAPNAPVLAKNLLTTARSKHIDHANACNDLATKLGGKPQTGPNPGVADLVAQARPGLNDLAVALDLAARLETTSMHTYQHAIGLIVDLNARRLAAMVMAVEAQHVALCLAGKGLAAARTNDLFGLDAGTAARLPPDAAVAGYPANFSKPDLARPSGEGAVK